MLVVSPVVVSPGRVTFTLRLGVFGFLRLDRLGWMGACVFVGVFIMESSLWVVDVELLSEMDMSVRFKLDVESSESSSFMSALSLLLELSSLFLSTSIAASGVSASL